MNKIIYIIAFTALNVSAFAFDWGHDLPSPYDQIEAVTDTIPLKDRDGDFMSEESNNPFDLMPSNIEQKVEYDPETNTYIIFEKIGDEYFRAPSYMTFQEYLEWSAKKEEEKYFSKLGGLDSQYKSGSGKVDPMSKIDIKNNLVDRLFGGTGVDIDAQGSIDITLGMDYQKIDNRGVDEFRRTQTGAVFDMDIQMNVDGNIGEKLNLGFNYNTQSNFDFDQKLKLEYDSEQFSEDDIIKKIEAGNVSLPLRSTLIQGAQSLFGIKTELQFGNLRLTGIISQQKSKQENLRIQNGTTEQQFELRPDQYDENRHFFISHYHRNRYEESLKNLPYIGNNFRITDIQVWVSEDRGDYLQNSRMIAALADIAEPIDTLFTASNEPMWNNSYAPQNTSNPLFIDCLLYTSPSPRDQRGSRMPSSA